MWRSSSSRIISALLRSFHTKPASYQNESYLYFCCVIQIDYFDKPSPWQFMTVYPCSTVSCSCCCSAVTRKHTWKPSTARLFTEHKLLNRATTYKDLESLYVLSRRNTCKKIGRQKCHATHGTSLSAKHSTLKSFTSKVCTKVCDLRTCSLRLSACRYTEGLWVSNGSVLRRKLSSRVTTFPVIIR